MIIAIRHLSTFFNRQNLLQGRANTSISLDIDQLQIEDNLKYISSLKIDKVFSSPLERTLQTSSLYGFSNPIISPLLTEYDFGEYELTPKFKFIKEHPEWVDNFTKVKIGEGYRAFSNRINLFLNELHPDKNYIIFSHGVVIRYLITKSLGLSLDYTNKLKVGNNSLNFI